MPATHTHYAATAAEMEAAMSATTIKPGTVRWLAANGHPGYSARTARRAAELIARFPGLSFHAAINGGRELAYRFEMEQHPL